MIAYLVLSHVNAAQVVRLVERLASEPGTAVFLRHDNTDHPLPPRAFNGYGNIYSVQARGRVTWGSYSQVEAVLDGVDAALASGIPYEWMVLISGQDYPCTNLAAFHDSLATAGVDGFLDHAPADEARLRTENADRYFFRYTSVPRGWRRLNSRLWRLNRLQPFVRFAHSRAGSRIGIADRRGFGGRTVYRGSFWWALSRVCTRELLDVSRRDAALVNAYRQRLHPDESFVQTVLLANPSFTFANDDLHFLRWDDPQAGSPALLGTADLPAILDSGKPFARKFDTRVDAHVLDRLDALALANGVGCVNEEHESTSGDRVRTADYRGGAAQ